MYVLLTGLMIIYATRGIGALDLGSLRHREVLGLHAVPEVLLLVREIFPEEGVTRPAPAPS